MSILLDTSIGEAVDKLSILDIKNKKINDNRLIHVNYEYNYLNDKINEYIKNLNSESIINLYYYYYNILYKINLEIWDIQDNIRNENINKNDIYNFYDLILDLNDFRFNIKNKLNNLFLSKYKEQKGYKIRKLLLLTHLGLGDIIIMNGAVRYLSFFYDKIDILVKDINYKNSIELYIDDPTINIISYNSQENHKMIYQNLILERPDYDILDASLDININNKITHSYFKNKPPVKLYSPHFIHKFYHKINLDFSIYTDYSYIPITDKSKKLYDMISSYDIIFYHNKASNFTITIDEINKFIYDPKYIIINPNSNIYPNNHILYDIAENFVQRDFFDYMSCIKNAEYIYTTDSSFFCIVMIMIKKNMLKTNKIFCRQRPDIYNESNILPSNLYNFNYI